MTTRLATARGAARPPRAASALRPVLLSAALGAVLPVAAAAQDPAERLPNPRIEGDLTFGLALERDEEGDISSAFTTGFGATLISETPISVLRLTAAGSLRLPLDGDEDDEDRFDGPSVELSYRREVPSATFAVNASYSQDDVDELGEGDDEDDEGTRRRLAADAFLSLLDDRPLGYEFALRLERIDYEGTTSTDLLDRDRAELATTVRLDFTEVLQARATARVRRTEEEGSEPETDLGFDLETALARPDGRYFGRVSVDETDTGEVVALRVGRDIERPRGPISATLGLRRDEDGDIDPVGTLNIARDLPNGRLTLAAEQGVGNFDGDDELVTRLATSFTRDLSPLTSLNLDASFLSVRNREDEEDLRILDLGASVSRALTPDWSLDLGYGVEFRDEGDEDRERTDNLSLTLRRSFVTGF